MSSLLQRANSAQPRAVTDLLVQQVTRVTILYSDHVVRSITMVATGQGKKTFFKVGEKSGNFILSQGKLTF